MGDIKIKIPIKENGDFDLETQKKIALKYEQIEKIKKNLKEDYEKINNLGVEIL